MRKRNFSEDSMRILLASLATIVVEAYADVPVGLIGGETSGSAAYAAFVASDGTLTPISDLPSSANTISSVAMRTSARLSKHHATSFSIMIVGFHASAVP